MAEARKKYPTGGVLLVVTYHYKQRDGLSEYQNVSVVPGPAAPNASVAIHWWKQAPKLFAEIKGYRPGEDYLWADIGGIRRAIYKSFDRQCVMGEKLT